MAFAASPSLHFVSLSSLCSDIGGRENLCTLSHRNRAKRKALSSVCEPLSPKHAFFCARIIVSKGIISKDIPFQSTISTLIVCGSENGSRTSENGSRSSEKAKVIFFQGEVFVGDQASAQIRERQEKAQRLLNDAKRMFERGKYTDARDILKMASELVPIRSNIGGDICLWLGMAYQTLAMRDEAQSVLMSLENHPNKETRRLADYLLDVLRAPDLPISDDERFNPFNTKRMSDILDNEYWAMGEFRPRSALQEKLRKQREMEREQFERYVRTLDPRFGINGYILFAFTLAFAASLRYAFS